MKIEISSKNFSIVLLMIFFLIGGGILVSPISPFAKESSVSCALRDGLSSEKLTGISDTLNQIKEKADPISTYEWQSQGRSMMEIMVILNSQLGAFEQKAASISLALSSTKPCKNNGEYLSPTQSLRVSMEAIRANLAQASRYQYFNFPLFASNATELLDNIAEFESEFFAFPE